MADLREQAAAMLRLLEGFADAYGTHGHAVPNERKGGKLEIKSTAATLQGKVTVELWSRHLAGKQPLGIVPIRADNTCLWGAIDVDVYDLDHAALYESCQRHKLPLLIVRTKSGGAHLYLLMAEPVEAAAMQDGLREMAALLGYGDSEIFPKQRAMLLGSGDFGNWLNMPYFNGDNTERYCIKKGGLALTLDEFIRLGESLRQPAAFLDQKFSKTAAKDPEWGDAPPCMQHLKNTGFPEGTRNIGLFNLGKFAKKKYPHNWQEYVEKWNYALMDPPLPAQEVVDIIKQLEKKDYNYSCKDIPLVSHCNSGVCRTRRYGVGGEEDFPLISGMSVLEADPPVWFLNVNDERLELTTEELQNYKSFHKRCMERLYVCFRPMKQETWYSIINNAMREATRIPVSEEVSDEGHFKELLQDFLTDRHVAQNRDELLLGKPWEDTEAGRHYFRLQDLQAFLVRHSFRNMIRSQLIAEIQRLDGGQQFFNIKGRGCNTWWVPAAAFSKIEPIATPPLDPEPI